MRIEMLPTTPVSACPTISESINEIVVCLESWAPSAPLENPSKQIKEHMRAHLAALGWLSDELLSQAPNYNLPRANYKISYFKIVSNCACRVRHRFFVQLCFDNKQVAGTHLLRFKLAEESTGMNVHQTKNFIVVVADEAARDTYGWDKSISTYPFLSQAFKVHYAGVVQTPIQFIVVRD